MASKKRSRATLATVDVDATLRSALVHLPIALYGPLLERGVPPQTIVVELARVDAAGDETGLAGGEGNAAAAVASTIPVDKIYVGWSGMSAAPLSTAAASSSAATSLQSSSSSPSAASVVCMSPTLATTFNPPLEAGAQVRITLLRAPPLPTASRIDVVPLSADDWEILSLNADEVENNMLGQVRAARTGMTIAVHVGRQGRTICRFRVEACTPPTQDYRASREAEGAARAVRLSTDTEVVIAPRTRTSPGAHEQPDDAKEFGAGSTAHRTSSAAASAQTAILSGNASASMLQTPAAAQEYLRRSPFRVVPANFSDSHDQPPRTDIALRPDDASILALAFAGKMSTEGRCAITKMPCPAAPDVYASASGSSNSPTNDSAAASSRKDQGNVEQNTAQGTDDGGVAAARGWAGAGPVPARATTSAYFGQPSAATDSWPRRHVWVSEQMRRKLGLHDYDLVRFSSPAPSGTDISRPSSPRLRPRSESHANADRSSANDLPGVLSPLNICLALAENAFRSRAWAAMEASMRIGVAGAGARAAAQKPQTTAALLLTGASGSGKTSIIKVLAARLAPSLVASITIDCTPHSEERLSVLRNLFDQWLAAAVWHSPTLLVLENLDRIAPADQEHVDSPRSAQVAEALMHRTREVTNRHAVFVAATAQSTSSLNKVCTTLHHVFGETVELKAPTKEARRDILAYLVAQRELLAPKELDYGVLAGQTEGYLPVDLRDIVERAVHQSAVRAAEEFMAGSTLSQGQDQDKGDAFVVDGTVDGASLGRQSNESSTFPNHISSVRHLLTMDDFSEAQRGFTPLSLRNIQLTRSATRWSDIGGLQETRRVLRETLEWPTRYARIFAQCPLRLRSGLLLYGFPGCGKTLLAGAVAAECGLNFISVKGPEILQKYIGASEKSVRDLFDRAQAAKPCVLFFDEFDSIAPKRGHDSTGVTDRVVNQLLTQMDGAEGLSGVYVLAATSRPDLIDSALLRPGRLDKSLLCDLPNEADRLDILQVVCRSNKIRLAEDVDLAAWARRTDGFSGADLQALVYNANLEAIHESMSASEAKGSQDGEGRIGAASGHKDGASKVRFVCVGGGTSAKTNAGVTMSSAERQATQRRMELIAQNAADNERTRRDAQRQSRRQRQDPSRAAAAPPTAAEDREQGQQGQACFTVTDALLHKCLRTTRQSVPADEQARLRRIYRQFVGERSGEFPSGEASSEVGARQSLM